jgi:hypothetical protein
MFGLTVLMNASAFTVKPSIAAFGIVLVAMLGAVLQWLVSAKSNRQRLSRAVLALVGSTALALILIDCGGGWWDWLCIALI